MDITELIVQLGSVNNKSFEDSLLKSIPMEFYYVLDILEKDDCIDIKVMKREGNPLEIPKRIKLYEYAVNNKIGASVSTFSLNNTDNLRAYLIKLKEDFNLDSFKDIENKEIKYTNSAEEFEDLYNLKFRGYTTIGINGKLLVDEIDNYDKKLVKKIYELNTYEGKSSCYLCNSENDLIYGGIKEPGIKMLSITRANEISQKKKEVFVRCFNCEKSLMKGFNLISEISVKSKRGKEVIESVMIPLFIDINLYNQMKKLRLEHSSDLKYYETLGRLFDRYSRRGLNQIIEIVFNKKMKNTTISSIDIIKLDNLKRLYFKKKYEVFLERNGFKDLEKDFLYYPEKIIKSKNEMKWKFIERIKRYWIGREHESIWDLIGKIEKISKRDILIYKLFNKFVESDDLLLEIKNDKYYWVGKFVKEIISVESKYIKSSENKIIKRFYVYNKNYDYVLNECIKSLDNMKLNFELSSVEIEILSDIYENILKNDYLTEDYYMLGRFERRVHSE